MFDILFAISLTYLILIIIIIGIIHNTCWVNMPGIWYAQAHLFFAIDFLKAI